MTTNVWVEQVSAIAAFRGFSFSQSGEHEFAICTLRCAPKCKIYRALDANSI